MGLFNYISEDEKKELEQNQETRVNQIKEKLNQDGLNDYQIEREIEKLFSKPDQHETFASTESNLITDVRFFFNEEEYMNFTKVFKVLTYVNNNCNQNWILMGLIKLVEDGKISINEKTKEVTYNG
jgi:uncharacterized protein YjcR